MKELFTKKIYYKKYSHRLQIKCKYSGATGRTKTWPTSDTIEWVVAQKFPDQFRGRENINYYGGRPSFYTLFFSNEEIFEFAKATFGDLLDEYERPMNSNHIEILEKGRDKVVTREKLFYDAYRVVIRISPPSDWAQQKKSQNYIRELQDWCKDNLGPEGDAWRISGYWNKNLYFKEANDAMLCKLTFSDYIRTTETVRLLSEIQNISSGA